MFEFYMSKCFIKGLPTGPVHPSSVHLSKQSKTSRTPRYKIAVTWAHFYHSDPFFATPSVAMRMSYRPLICPLILVTVSTNFVNDYDGDKMVSSSMQLHFHRWKHKSEPTYCTKRYKTLTISPPYLSSVTTFVTTLILRNLVITCYGTSN